jgi:AAA+ superfamily predicted ATPase
MESHELNAASLAKEMDWLTAVITRRFAIYFQQGEALQDITGIKPPDLSSDNSVYASTIKKLDLSFSERLIIVLALSPHIRPQVLDVFFTKNSTFDRGFSEFGGIKGENFGGFLPTGETAAFVLGADNIVTRIKLLEIFDSSHTFYRKKVLSLDLVKDNEPKLSGVLTIEQDHLDLFTIGKVQKPTFTAKFPATPVEIKADWEDLVLDPQVKKQIDHIYAWIKNNDLIMDAWEMKDKIKPGYRALFYGPPGTGKTFTAGLIGKSTGKDVYKIDVSMMVSKWVGETEKNLARVFDMAENKDWILFFDEADALFGKRSDTNSSQDRYSNQEVSYLLQRTEEYPGTIILSSNLKGNIDEAFIRRFQSMVYFTMPNEKERFLLWQKAFDGRIEADKKIDLKKIAKEYMISGGAIMNVLKFCAIRCSQKKSAIVLEEDLIDGIKSEFLKEGKTV